MNYKIKELADFPDPVAVWQKIVDDTSYAWFWSTYAQYRFRISVLKASGRLVGEKSFILLQEGKPCGLAPLIFVKAIDFEGIQASYDNPLPWPMVADCVDNRIKAADFMLDELERRIQNAGAGMLRLMLSPPSIGNEYEKWFIDTVRRRGFIDSSFLSHYVDITPSTLESVRKRYKRYVKKFWEKYECRVLESNDCYADIAGEYMDIHVKDAGKVSRPIETYEAQIDLIRSGEGFVIQTRNKPDDKLVGMLIISNFKHAAYDSSVAVDPVYREDYVSHLMKWKAIQHLQEINVNHYELGPAAVSPTYLWQPSAKNYGISHFKEGWCRLSFKKVFIAEKYYSKSAVEGLWRKKLDNLLEHFDLSV
jgi:hypothetical protein